MPKNISTDAEVKLTNYLSEKKYLRVLDLLDTMIKNELEFTFIANAKYITAIDIANVYKKK